MVSRANDSSVSIEGEITMSELKDRFNAIFELMHLKQEGSVRDYQDKFEAILARLNLSEDRMIHFFINGLKARLQSVVHRFFPKTLHEAYGLAKLEELTISYLQSDDSMDSSSPKSSPLLQNDDLFLRGVPKSTLLPESSSDIQIRCSSKTDDFVIQHKKANDQMLNELAEIKGMLINICSNLNIDVATTMESSRHCPSPECIIDKYDMTYPLRNAEIKEMSSIVTSPVNADIIDNSLDFAHPYLIEGQELHKSIHKTPIFVPPSMDSTIPILVVASHIKQKNSRHISCDKDCTRPTNTVFDKMSHQSYVWVGWKLRTMKHTEPEVNPGQIDVHRSNANCVDILIFSDCEIVQPFDEIPQKDLSWWHSIVTIEIQYVTTNNLPSIQSNDNIFNAMVPYETDDTKGFDIPLKFLGRRFEVLSFLTVKLIMLFRDIIAMKTTWDPGGARSRFYAFVKIENSFWLPSELCTRFLHSFPLKVNTKGLHMFKERYAVLFVCWVLGLGCLISWNNMLTIGDYYAVSFLRYHPSRVPTLVYQQFAFGTIAILTRYETNLNTRLRNITGYLIFLISSFLVIVLDLVSSGNGGLGTYIGICVVSATFGIADAHAQGGVLGDLSLMDPAFVQSFVGGLAASGAIASLLRLVTKAAFENSHDGLRKGAILFFALCTFVELVCVIIYAYVFPKLGIVKYYPSTAAIEGSKTVIADLAAAGIDVKDHVKDVVDPTDNIERLSTKELFWKNRDYAVALYLIYMITLSIFPEFIYEDTGSHHLSTWYVLVLSAAYIVADLVGRYTPLIKAVQIKLGHLLVVLSLSRLLFIPAFHFTAKYDKQGWMIMLTSLLGITNGQLTVCVPTEPPKGYKGPEKNALGNLLCCFLLARIFSGVILVFQLVVASPLASSLRTRMFLRRRVLIRVILVGSELIYIRDIC